MSSLSCWLAGYTGDWGGGSDCDFVSISGGGEDGCLGHAGGEVVVEIAGVEGVEGAGVD